MRSSTRPCGGARDRARRGLRRRALRGVARSAAGRRRKGLRRREPGRADMQLVQEFTGELGVFRKRDRRRLHSTATRAEHGRRVTRGCVGPHSPRGHGAVRGARGGGAAGALPRGGDGTGRDRVRPAVLGLQAAPPKATIASDGAMPPALGRAFLGPGERSSRAPPPLSLRLALPWLDGSTKAHRRSLWATASTTSPAPSEPIACSGRGGTSWQTPSSTSAPPRSIPVRNACSRGVGKSG